jgi:hypothetical protein
MLNYHPGPWDLNDLSSMLYTRVTADGLTIRFLGRDADKISGTARLVAAAPEMYELLKGFCRFSLATDPHEVAALQSKAQMLLQEIEGDHYDDEL